MNKLVLVLLLALLGEVAASAATYQIKLRGSLLSSSGRTRIKETDLVTTNGHFLAYRIDLGDKSLDIVEMFPNTNVFVTHIHTDDVVVGPDGRGVVFDLHESSGFIGNIAGLPPFSGRLLGVGRVRERSFRFNVLGVWDGGSDTAFRGVITGKRID